LVAAGHQVMVQAGAGLPAAQPDAAYAAAGAEIVDAEVALGCDLVLKVRSPQAMELSLMRPGAAVVGMLDPFDRAGLEAMAASGLTAFALEAAPRITRAQSLDVLSSQANIAGYKAVLIAANVYPRFFPMLMTAAGTVKAARVLVLGAGVAGLQAIATAKRLGAVVEAFDVRPDVKEQVESLGAKFVEVPLTPEEAALAKGQGGYAREMGEDYKQRQSVLVAERVALADVVITTALIPGRAAPLLVTGSMVAGMRAGAVIVDMAAGRGADGICGNCELSEADRNVVRHGIVIVGETNLPAMLAADASALYARNVLDFLKLVIDGEGHLHIDTEDEILRG
ncbi:MAG: NAD(P) transhydrogenase subunit alpha, partial [Betaproteobacteria bacterium]|nr:NAD(P) transhydrogenase subunit alpha [Betaproteobacteria bacterium]